MNQLAYLVYGNKPDIIDEARFSILSALYCSKERNRLKLVVVTDTPGAFSTLPVTIEPIEMKELREWYGPDGYHHRSKPHAALKIIHKAEKTVLIDTDTVFLKDSLELFQAFNDQQVLVDKILSPWQKTPHEFLDTCGPYLASQYDLPKNFRSINSGVIGLTPSSKELLQDAIRIIDQIYNLSGQLVHTEQFALAVAIHAHNLQVVTHQNIIHHYWSRKTIHRAIGRSFLSRHSDWFSEDAKQEFKKISFSIPRPPWPYRLFIRFKSKMLGNTPQLRQFYVELCRAFYPNPPDDFVQAAMIRKALVNLQERNTPLLEKLLEDGVESLIDPHLFSNLSARKINEIAKSLRKQSDTSKLA